MFMQRSVVCPDAGFTYEEILRRASSGRRYDEFEVVRKQNIEI